MKKKKLLFVMDTFPLGGIAKSLLALFNELDDNLYDIDFLLMKKEGFLLPLIPDKIHLLNEPISDAYRKPHPKYILSNLRKLQFKEWIYWLFYSAKCTYGRMTGGISKQIQNMDIFIAKHADPIDTKYDAAIAYQGGRCIYYIAEHINAKVKIGYVHSDYTQSPADYRMKEADNIYFPKMNHIVTISDACCLSLRKEFPEISKKFVVIENICSEKMINRMANVGDPFGDQWNEFRIVTMGRIEINTKGLDYAVQVCKKLINKGFKFKWYLIGDGDDKNKLYQMIKKYGVEDYFFILGAKINPYPFIKYCDIYVQPSRYEGKSVALDEVKALHKPIVVTRFSTVNDQFSDGITAMIAEFSVDSITEKISKLIENKKMRDKLSANLCKEKISNEEEVKAFEALLR